MKILRSRKRKIIIIKATQNFLLFAIAALLVTGFYYHAEFYKLGWLGLIIIGTIITFIVLKAILYLSYAKYYKGDFEGFLIFKPEEVGPIKHGQIKQIIRPARESYIKPGAIYKAKLNVMSHQYFSELLIKNIILKKLKELSEKDIFLTGVRSRTEFKDFWMSKYGNWTPEIKVRLIRFEPIN